MLEREPGAMAVDERGRFAEASNIGGDAATADAAAAAVAAADACIAATPCD